MVLLIGFLGGLLAVVAKGAVDYWLERRRELRALASAARLMREEIETADDYADLVFDLGEWLRSEEPFTVTTEAWDAHRGVFASVRVDDLTWASVTAAAKALRMLKAKSERAVPDAGGDLPSLSDEDAQTLLELRDAFQDA